MNNLEKMFDGIRKDLDKLQDECYPNRCGKLDVIGVANLNQRFVRLTVSINKQFDAIESELKKRGILSAVSYAAKEDAEQHAAEKARK